MRGMRSVAFEAVIGASKGDAAPPWWAARLLNALLSILRGW
jgi:hypothetical protein